MPEEKQKPTYVEVTPETLTYKHVDTNDLAEKQQKEVIAQAKAFKWLLTKSPLPIRILYWVFFLGLVSFFLFLIFIFFTQGLPSMLESYRK